MDSKHKHVFNTHNTENFHFSVKEKHLENYAKYSRFLMLRHSKTMKCYVWQNFPKNTIEVPKQEKTLPA